MTKELRVKYIFGFIPWYYTFDVLSNDIYKKIRNRLLIRGFTNKKLLNNRGLIGAIIDDVILEMTLNKLNK